MTLLSICANVAKAVGAQTPTAIIGSSDQTAQRLFQAIKQECNFLVRRFNWSALRREATITTVASTASYALESDFHRILDDTAWDRTNHWSMGGSATAGEWQFFKSATATRPVTRRRFRLMWDPVSKAREVFIDPTPSDVATLVYEYVSNQYCQATGGGALKSEWSVDTDVPLLDDDLIELGVKYRYLRARGQPYADEHNDYRRALLVAIGNDRPARTVNLAGSETRAFQLPDGNFTL